MTGLYGVKILSELSSDKTPILTLTRGFINKNPSKRIFWTPNILQLLSYHPHNIQLYKKKRSIISLGK